MKVLLVSHNDPRLHPGGTEIFAHGLFRALDARPEVEAAFLAGVNQLHRERRPGTAFQAVPGGGPNEFLMWCGHYDMLCHSQIDGMGVFPELEDLLRELRPDVVHFHHFLLFGLEALHVVRRVLPQARIILTVHDYHLLCPNDGLLRTTAGTLCAGPSADACTRCRPDATPIALTLREGYAKTLLSCVDTFIAPSRFLAGHLARWGIDAGRIVVVRNGHALGEPRLPRPLAAPGQARSSFAVFGNQNPHKGTLVALEAARRLVDAGRRDFTLHLHGAPLFQDEAFRQALAEALAPLAGIAIAHGAYDHADLPRRMASADWVIVPSLWYENAPLTIQEAFHHGRPVLCSDIGGMAEAVRDGHDGLHFAAGDAEALAAVMARALDTPGLWESLRDRRPPVPDMAACTAAHLDLYRTPPVRAAAASGAATAGGRP